VEGSNTNVSDVVATNSDVASDVCEVISNTLLEGKRVDWLFVKDDKMWVNTGPLRQLVLMQNRSAKYTDRDITRAVSSISEGHKNLRTQNRVKKMWAFRPEALRAWCENSHVHEWKIVEAAIKEIVRKEAWDIV
jgi:hypothetical protein